MEYSELFAVTDLLRDVREGKEIKVDDNTKIDLAEVENVFKNILLDIDKKKVGSNEEIIYYRLTIEVKK